MAKSKSKGKRQQQKSKHQRRLRNEEGAPPHPKQCKEETQNENGASDPAPSISPSDKSSPDNRPFYVKKRTYTAISFVITMWWLFHTPRLLHEAGVLDRDPLEEFLIKTVYPSIESRWAVFNGTFTSNEVRPGSRLAEQGAKAKYPVVIVPGFVTSALEQWEGEPCSEHNFRQAIWGSVAMAKSFFADRECWRRHLSLDPITGMDPPGIRLRAAQGFQAVDQFTSVYWVWSKMIENLADVGYDGSLMTVAPYDWRLGFPLLEKRDGYFTKLRHSIEAYHETTGEKVMLMSHSMGGAVVLYFMTWVTTPKSEGGGGGGEGWVEEHVHTFINIAGTLLGVPKAVPALLSGELKDTAALLNSVGEMLENFFGRKKRRDLWVTWGSLFGMLPKGGDEVWGVGADICQGNKVEAFNCSQSAEGDQYNAPLIIFTETGCIDTEINSNAATDTDISQEHGVCAPTLVESIEQTCGSDQSCSIDKTIKYLITSGSTGTASSKMYNFDNNHIHGKKLPEEQHWHNPMATPLPHAPSMKIYCLYGTGIATERAYFYKAACDNPVTNNATECKAYSDIIIDTTLNDAKNNISNGVKFSDGDGSVPLISSGYMCESWSKDRSRNPSDSKVITREYPHQEEFSMTDPMRGGPRSAEHVDILGHLDVLEDIVKIVTDFEVSSVQRRVLSDLERIVEQVDSKTKMKTRE